MTKDVKHHMTQPSKTYKAATILYFQFFCKVVVTLCSQSTFSRLSPPLNLTANHENYYDMHIYSDTYFNENHIFLKSNNTKSPSKFQTNNAWFIYPFVKMFIKLAVYYSIFFRNYTTSRSKYEIGLEFICPVVNRLHSCHVNGYKSLQKNKQLDITSSM